MILSIEIVPALKPEPPRLVLADHDDGGSRRSLACSVPNFARRRVYVASPVATFHTPRYDEKLTQIRGRFPQADLLSARDLFRSTNDWLQHWPAFLTTLTDLVFFAEVDATIGYGVWCELQDAVEQVPVWYLDDEDRWHTLDDIEVEITGDSLVRFAFVCAEYESNPTAELARRGRQGGA